MNETLYLLRGSDSCNASKLKKFSDSELARRFFVFLTKSISFLFRKWLILKRTRAFIHQSKKVLIIYYQEHVLYITLTYEHCRDKICLRFFVHEQHTPSHKKEAEVIMLSLPASKNKDSDQTATMFRLICAVLCSYKHLLKEVLVNGQ